MKIADLDLETRAVLCCAHIAVDRPTRENLERLRSKLQMFHAKHEGERTRNLLNTLVGSNGIMHEEDDATKA
jgi:hypothetical protein